MSQLKIEPTRTTPFVTIDTDNGILNFKGRSAPKSSINFFFPIIENIKQELSHRKEAITANFCFEYFNTSSSKCLYDILRELSRIKENNGAEVQVNWFYEDWDEDMRESGEDYEDLLNMQFNYVVLED